MEPVVYRVYVGPELVMAVPSRSPDGGYDIIRPVRAEDPNDGFLDAWMPTDAFERHYRELTDGEKELLGL